MRSKNPPNQTCRATCCGDPWKMKVQPKVAICKVNQGSLNHAPDSFQFNKLTVYEGRPNQGWRFNLQTVLRERNFTADTQQ